MYLYFITSHSRSDFKTPLCSLPFWKWIKVNRFSGLDPQSGYVNSVQALLDYIGKINTNESFRKPVDDVLNWLSIPEQYLRAIEKGAKIIDMMRRNNTGFDWAPPSVVIYPKIQLTSLTIYPKMQLASIIKFCHSFYFIIFVHSRGQTSIMKMTQLWQTSRLVQFVWLSFDDRFIHSRSQQICCCP